MAGTTPKNLSYLDLIDLCDNVHIGQAGRVSGHGFDAEELVPFYLNESPHSTVIGLLRPIIVEQLKLENARSRELGLKELWDIRVIIDGNAASTAAGTDADVARPLRRLKNGEPGSSVGFRNWADTPGKRTKAMREMCERWRDTGLFADVCGPTKWRGELYPVYADPFGRHDHPNDDEGGDENQLNFVFETERSACALFGVVTYGVHMSTYRERVDGEGRKCLEVWVPTRAKNKPTFPGLLDNTVAGGIPSGMGVLESLMKECMEEASLGAAVVEQHARAVGAISYFFRTSKGWLQPEVEYVYDMVIPPDADPALFEPKPMDGEVECFELMDQELLISKLRAGLFKPNCGLVIIDLFIRLGYITPDNEPDYMKILTRLHGDFGYDRWS